MEPPPNRNDRYLEISRFAVEEHDVIPLLIDYQTEFLLLHFHRFLEGQLQYHSPEKKIIFSFTILQFAQNSHYKNTVTVIYYIETAHKNFMKCLYVLCLNGIQIVGWVFFSFIMIHLSVFFNITLLNIEGIQVLNIKINIFQ